GAVQFGLRPRRQDLVERRVELPVQRRLQESCLAEPPVRYEGAVDDPDEMVGATGEMAEDGADGDVPEGDEPGGGHDAGARQALGLLPEGPQVSHERGGLLAPGAGRRSEERRVRKEWRTRGSAYGERKT